MPGPGLNQFFLPNEVIPFEMTTPPIEVPLPGDVRRNYYFIPVSYVEWQWIQLWESLGRNCVLIRQFYDEFGFFGNFYNNSNPNEVFNFVLDGGTVDYPSEIIRFSNTFPNSGVNAGASAANRLYEIQEISPGVWGDELIGDIIYYLDAGPTPPQTQEIVIWEPFPDGSGIVSLDGLRKLKVEMHASSADTAVEGVLTANIPYVTFCYLPVINNEGLFNYLFPSCAVIPPTTPPTNSFDFELPGATMPPWDTVTGLQNYGRSFPLVLRGKTY